MRIAPASFSQQFNVPNQAGRGSISGFNWWTYYQAYLFGRDGVNGDFFSNATDFFAGALGICFTTPDPGTNPVLAAVGRVLILSGAVALILRLLKGARSLPSPNRPVASHKPFGIPYAPPYPSIQDPKLKKTINFADWS